jgi:hypothetical protein
MYICLYVKCPLFLSDFNEAWILPKNFQISNLMKIRLAGSELFHADGQTDMTILVVAFRNLRTLLKSCGNGVGFVFVHLIVCLLWYTGAVEPDVWSVPLQGSSLTQFPTVLDFTCTSIYAFCHNATMLWVSWAWFRVLLSSSYFQDIKF